jgi:hypothetical protein
VANFLAGLLLMPLCMIFRGWVLSRLWLWFVVPGLHAPSLSIPIAIGFSILGTTMVISTAKQDEAFAKAPFYEKQLAGALVELAGLSLGWVVHLLVLYVG